MKWVLLLGLGFLFTCGCGDDDKDDSKNTEKKQDTDEDTDDTGLNPVVNKVCPFDGDAEPDGKNWVNGDLIEFNDNGGWCWYQDERVIVDQDADKMLIGSVAYGGDRNQLVEVTDYDLSGGDSERYTLGKVRYTDDHDAPALIKRPDGGYAAMWAGHNDDCYSYYSVFDGESWTEDVTRFDWTEYGCPTPPPTSKKITYANLWYMGDTLYSFVRSLETSPHFLYSTNDGDAWKMGGRLTASPQVGYVAGYYKYWGNNVDRIDFLGTEAHPRDNDNSLWHGYVKKEGDKVKIYNSFDEVIDEDATDMDAEDISAFTEVFATGTEINDVGYVHLWNSDLVRYEDGTIAAIGSAREKGSIGAGDPTKALLYFRFDGTEWKTTYLAQAGIKLYESEEDYTGLGALDPDNPHIIYISTPFDPSTGEGDYEGKKEIWKGVTCDDGESFTWEPVTANSDVDNIRPVIPKWTAKKTALLWLRGTYSSAQQYELKIVGLFDELKE